MDLLLFADEEELPNQLLNSEDSNQSLKQIPESDEMGENHQMSEPVSAEDKPNQPLERDNESAKRIGKEDHAQKLIKAQERRERARRFASFTSWMPDLQRVWAPKQPKATKLNNLDPLRKLSKRKRRGGESNDTVCETPMTGKKHSSSRSNYGDGKRYEDYGNQSCPSVSKALFQDPC